MKYGYHINSEKYQILENDIKEVILYFIAQKKENYQYIGENAKKLIKESYTWENYEQKLINLLNKAMSR